MTQDLSRSFGQPLTSSLRGLLPSRRTEAADASDAADGSSASDPAESRSVRSSDVQSSGSEAATVATPGSDTTPAPGASTPEEPDMTEHDAAPASRRRANGVRPRDASRSTTGSSTDSRSTRTPAARVRAAPAAPGTSVTSGTSGTNRRWGSARVVSREHVDLLVLLALERGPGDGRAVVARLHADSGGVLDAPERTVHRTLHRLARNRLLVRRVDSVSGRPSYSLTDTGQRATRARVREWRALTRAVVSILREGDT